MRRQLTIAAGIVLLAAPAFALDLPTRKAGLWEIKILFESRNLPVQTMHQCIDAASDKVMNANFGGSMQETSSKRDMQNVGNTIVVDSVCKFGAATTTSHAVMTGSFDSAYSVASTRSGGAMAPGMPANGQSHLKIEAKWMGPCAAGQKPGDVIVGNGFKMNMLEMQNLRGQPPKR